MTDMDPELRRRINTNLRELADGTVARREAAKKAAKEANKALIREDKATIRQIDKRLKAVTTERDGLQEYLDELLDRPEDTNPLGYAGGGSPEQYNGLLEECDAAVNGCNEEIVALQNRREVLQRSIDARS